jgi:hypothetical protein
MPFPATHSTASSSAKQAGRKRHMDREHILQGIILPRNKEHKTIFQRLRDIRGSKEINIIIHTYFEF